IWVSRRRHFADSPPVHYSGARPRRRSPRSHSGRRPRRHAHGVPFRMLCLREEHLQVREMARKFADEVVAPRAREIDETEQFPTDIVRQMCELGFMGLPYPEKYGGAGLDTLAYAIAVEEISRACGSTGITLAAHVSLGCGPVYGFGNEEQKMRFL